MAGPLRFCAPPSGDLSRAMQQAWHRDGFLVLERFATPRQCRELVAQMETLTDAFEPTETASIFSTRSDAHARDAYFMDSGGEVRFFLEEEAVDEEGKLCVPKALALNKVGHALHDRDPVFKRFSRTSRLQNIAHHVGLRKPALVQSMYIFKSPHYGGEVRWHQDSAFLHTKPLSVVGFWIALADATRHNGCLKALPGYHREPLRARFRRAGVKADLETLDPTPWPVAEAVDLEVPQGTLVLLHGSLPHASAVNRSSVGRPAYTLHMIDGVARYSDDNWLQRSEPFRGF